MSDSYKKLQSDEYIKKISSKAENLIEYIIDYGFDEASVLVTTGSGKNYNISKTGTGVSDNSLICSRGYVVRVVKDGKWAEYSLSKVEEEDFPYIAKKLNNTLCLISDTLGSKLTDFDDENIVGYSEYKVHPGELGSEKIIGILENIRNKTMSISEKVMDVNVYCSYASIAKLHISKRTGGKMIRKEQNTMWMTSFSRVYVANGEAIKDYFKVYSNLGGAEVFEDMEKDIPNTVETALQLLESTPIEPGEYECICTPDVTGMIAHEAFGHGVEMDMFVKKRALAEEYIGKYVASELITMHDGAASAQEVATYFFDDEGVAAKDTVIIDKGILKSGISDLRSALQTNTVPTGNGRRESYKRKAYTRMTNTFFEAGKDKVEDMIASIKYGFLLENAGSGMEDPKNWGIQCMVNIAREIKDGKLTGKVFSPIVLTGYVPDLLKSITMVSDKIELSGGGFCGKGYKEWVKVSDGGPYIKAKIRLG